MSQRTISALLAAVVALLVLRQTEAQADFLTGLKAYYDFNQSSGSSLPLVVGAGNNGVLNNMDNSDWVAGQANFGNALDFDGINDFVHIASGFTNTIQGDDTHTVSMWFYARSVANTPLLLDAEDTTGSFGYFLELGDNGTNKFYAGTGGSFLTYTSPSITLNT